MVYYPRRMYTKKRPRRRRSLLGFKLPKRTLRRPRLIKRRSSRRPRVMSTQAARAFFDASRHHHSPDLGVPDMTGSYTPVRGVTRDSRTAPTGLGSAFYVFCWNPSQARCMHLTHQLSEEGWYNIHFPFLASHVESAGPSMVRPLRQSVSIRNIASSQTVNGYIRILHTNHPMTIDFTGNHTDSGAQVRMSTANYTAFKAMMDSHPNTRTITNVELRTGISIPIVVGTISVFKEYHPWVSINPVSHDRQDFTDADGNVYYSTEQYAAGLIQKYLTLTPMSTLIVEIPTMEPTNVQSYDMAYHYQDAVRAADPDGIVAQFARPGRPMSASQFNRFSAAANRTVMFWFVFCVSCLSILTVELSRPRNVRGLILLFVLLVGKERRRLRGALSCP